MITNKHISIIILICLTSCIANANDSSKHYPLPLALYHPLVSGTLVTVGDMVPNYFWIYYKNMRQLQYTFKHTDPNKRISLNPRIFFRGFYLAMAATTPAVCVQMGSYEKLKLLFQKYSSPFVSDLLASWWAGTLSALFVCPAERVTLLKQDLGWSYKQTFNAIYKSNNNLKFWKGLLSFYKGFWATALLYNSVTMSFFTLSPYLSTTACAKRIENEQLRSIASSLVVSIPIALLTQPFDRTRTLLFHDLDGRYKSSWQIMHSIYKERNYKNFLPGTIPSLIRVILGVMIQTEIAKALCLPE